MGATATDNVTSNATTQPFPQSRDDLIYINALRLRGYEVELCAGGRRFKIAPKSKLCQEPKVRAKIQSHREDILAELHAEQSFLREESIWADEVGQPPHDLNRLTVVISSLFAMCQRLGWATTQYYEPTPNRRTERPARPYCYVKPELVDGHWFYRPMIAETDASGEPVDSVWAEVEERTTE